MSALATLLGSRVRAEILCLLFAGRDEELHVREIARRCGCSERAARQELAKLAALELVVPRRDGNRLYYSALREHPLYADLRGLVCKTAGIIETLKDALASPKVETAFVFGSLASGVEKASSDIDIMVIGDVGPRELTGMLSGLSERIGREINPHVLTEGELRRRLKHGDHFLTSVLREPRVMVVGDGRELAALAS